MLPKALKKLPFASHLSVQNVRKVVSQADGYQPHLIAPELGYRRLIESSLKFFTGPALASVETVSSMLLLSFLVYKTREPQSLVMETRFELKVLCTHFTTIYQLKWTSCFSSYHCCECEIDQKFLAKFGYIHSLWKVCVFDP